MKRQLDHTSVTADSRPARPFDESRFHIPPPNTVTLHNCAHCGRAIHWNNYKLFIQRPTPTTSATRKYFHEAEACDLAFLRNLDTAAWDAACDQFIMPHDTQQAIRFQRSLHMI